jgi:hypothetical protein
MSRDDRRHAVWRSIESTCLAGLGVMFAITLVSPMMAEAYPPTTPSSSTTITVVTTTTIPTSTTSTTTTVQIGGPTTTSIPPTTVRQTTTSVQSGGPTTTRPGEIPATGANSVDLVQVAVVTVIAGLCLLGVVGLRRRPPAR